MRRVNNGLAIIAVVGQAMGRQQSAQDLYCLAQGSGHIALSPSAGDVEYGLGLLGIDAFRVVAPGYPLPKIIPFALEEGHVVLAEIAYAGARVERHWVILTSADAENWAGVLVGWDMIAHGYSSFLPWILTGHYVMCANPLPEWAADLP
jgi:hypothetical protein